MPAQPVGSARATATPSSSLGPLDVACGAAHCAEMMIALSVEARMGARGASRTRTAMRDTQREPPGKDSALTCRVVCKAARKGEVRLMDSADLQWVKG
jgi:hypothetical protein